jgi:hypothetical protein
MKWQHFSAGGPLEERGTKKIREDTSKKLTWGSGDDLPEKHILCNG